MFYLNRKKSVALDPKWLLTWILFTQANHRKKVWRY